MPGCYLKLDRDRFLPHLFQFIIIPIVRRNANWFVDSVVKLTQCAHSVFPVKMWGSADSYVTIATLTTFKFTFHQSVDAVYFELCTWSLFYLTSIVCHFQPLSQHAYGWHIYRPPFVRYASNHTESRCSSGNVRPCIFQQAMNGTVDTTARVVVLAYSLTPWSRDLLEKLTISHPVKKFPAFYATRRFVTAFTSALPLSLSWARSIQSMPPPHPTSWRSILKLTSHLRLGLPCSLFPTGFPTKTLCTPVVAVLMCDVYSRHGLQLPLRLDDDWPRCV